MKTKTIIIGSGGHAQVIIDILRGHEELHICGVLDKDNSKTGSVLGGVPILGDDSLLKTFDPSYFFVIGVGSTADNSLRKQLFLNCQAAGLQPFTVIHPSAVIADSAKLGAGVQILAGAIVGYGSVLGDNILINTGSVIEHHCKIESHSHVASGACLAGQVKLGEESFVGCGAVVIQNITVGKRTTIGAGSVVIRDVPDSYVVAGNPARKLR